ncbi:MAG: tetratricopeptide repeat protein [Marivibrio sp.]|uniref:tetratricopeptide repeat protein n=1 Tax=Marivibrio sp. TaxID=2039719 RepID=UPI0032EF94B0
MAERGNRVTRATGLRRGLTGAAALLALGACAHASDTASNAGVAPVQAAAGAAVDRPIETVETADGGAVTFRIAVAEAAEGALDGPAAALAGDGGGFGAYLAGRHAENESDYEAAATLLDQVLAEQPDDDRLVRRAFIANINAGRFERAHDLAQKIDARSPIGMGLATLTRSAHALKTGDYETAAEEADAAERTSLARFAAPLFAAWALAGAGQTDSALAALEEIDGDGGWGQLVTLHRGLIEKRAGRLDAALETFAPPPLDDASDGGEGAEGSDGALDPVVQMPVRMLRAYARVRLEAGQPSDAVLGMLRAYDAANPEITVVEGDIRSLEADGALDALVVDPPAGVAEGLYHLASGVRRQADSIALAYGRLATFLDPQMALSRLLVAEVLEARSRHREAIEELRLIPADSDYGWSARLATADNLIALERDAEAVEHLDEMAAERPEDIEALMKMGYLMRLRERFEEGVEVYSRALDRIETVEDRHWLVYYYYGITLERTDRWPRAEEAFLTALDLKPGDPYVLNYLGYSWVDKGMNIERAEAMIREAVEQRQNDGYIVDSLGWVYYKLGRYEQAVRHLERAVQLRPQDPVINDHLGDAYWKVGRKLEARFQWERVRTLDADDDLLEQIDVKLEGGLAALEGETETAGQ